MGDEDNDIFDIAEDDWLTSDTYTNPNYEWFGSHSPSYSDVETWLIEKSIEANKEDHEARRIEAKRELYLMKCKLDRIYDSLPKHPKQELEWDKEEVVRILKEEK